MGTIQTIITGVRSIGTGFRTTLKHLFHKPFTQEYPEYKRQLPERSRARIVLTRDPDGRERCVACYLCSAVCPVSCISMQAAEDDKGRRYATWFRINFGRCIYCGLCEEACPTSAIQLTPDFENCKSDILALVFEKKDLLVNHGGKDPDYDFYQHAGIITHLSGKGDHVAEEDPLNVKTNLP